MYYYKRQPPPLCVTRLLSKQHNVWSLPGTSSLVTVLMFGTGPVCSISDPNSSNIRLCQLLMHILTTSTLILWIHFPHQIVLPISSLVLTISHAGPKPYPSLTSQRRQLQRLSVAGFNILQSYLLSLLIMDTNLNLHHGKAHTTSGIKAYSYHIIPSYSQEPCSDSPPSTQSCTKSSLNQMIWRDSLPMVLLGHHTVWKDNIHCTAAELIPYIYMANSSITPKSMQELT